MTSVSTYLLLARFAKRLPDDLVSLPAFLCPVSLCLLKLPGHVRLLSRFISIVFIIVVLSACQASQESSLSGESEDADNWLSLLARESTDASAPGPIEFPADLKSHPQARAESFVLEAVLQSSDAEPVSVQVQIDRAALKKDMTLHSSWTYTDVMRASMTIGKQASRIQSHRESISRVALGLAGSEAAAMHVADIDLSITLGESCDAHYSLLGTSQDGILVSLSWQLFECPAKQSLGQFKQWSAAAVQVSGSLQEEGQVQEVSGYGWITHRFGNLPSANGAVVIDQARLILDNQWVLEASRSRRRSGRGPQSVVGTMGAMQHTQVAHIQTQTKSIDMQWREDGTKLSASSNALYPAKIRFDSEEQGLSLLLIPMVETPEIADRLGIRWSAAVKVSGSHEGYGFVNMNPLMQGQPQ